MTDRLSITSQAAQAYTVDRYDESRALVRQRELGRPMTRFESELPYVSPVEPRGYKPAEFEFYKPIIYPQVIDQPPRGQGPAYPVEPVTQRQTVQPVDPDKYNTVLSMDDEVKFQAWKKQYAPKDSGEDYDLRGAFKAGLTPDPKTGHWPDTYKKPNHPTFSNESKYAKDRPDLAGHWEGPNHDKYVPPRRQINKLELPTGGGQITDMQGNVNPAHFMRMKPEARAGAERISSMFGRSLQITPHGGFSPRASASSQHPAGEAIDVSIASYSPAERTRLITAAIKSGARGIGGYGAGDGYNTLHFDFRKNPGRGPAGLALWWRHQAGKDSSWTTAPSWFQAGIEQGLATAVAGR